MAAWRPVKPGCVCKLYLPKTSCRRIYDSELGSTRLWAYSNHQFEGIIREVSDSAILVEKNGTVEAINLDFVIRIREFPKNKKGKKKSVVLD